MLFIGAANNKQWIVRFYTVISKQFEATEKYCK